VKLRIGIIVNPIAGIGGTAALKGSDGTDVQAMASARGARSRAVERMRDALAPLRSRASELVLVAWGGPMGADAAAGLGFDVEVLGDPASPTSAADTRIAASAMATRGVDVLVFAGGDGTARDLAGVLPASVPVIGVPAGVKMHSGVFAVTPRDAAALTALLLDGKLVAAETAEVRDIDEAALRDGRIATQYYGELTVPRIGAFLQHVKSSGREVEELVLAELAEWVAERVAHHQGYLVLGPGSTLAAVKRRLGSDATLLGFDVMRDGRTVIRDADATALEAIADPDTLVVLSFTRGQGFLVGRGNQQLTPEILRRLPRDNIWVVASRTKLLSLDGRPLLVDSGAADVDEKLRGLVTIVSGYEDVLLYRVGRT
jgi:predicted polyphosphate/ATP-dependent NAD kinase